MAAIFKLPRGTLFDNAGAIEAGGSVRFFDAGTSNQQTVYSDPDLDVSHAITQPIEADSAGRLPTIYMTPGTYKLIVYDDADAIVYTADDLDTGFPAESGVLLDAIPGFFAAENAQAARDAIAAASQDEVDTISTDLAALLAQVTVVGGTLGALAGLDDIGTEHLETGFGSVILQRVLIDSEAAVVSCAGTFPYDDSIPQISEGTEFLTGNFTPLSASSVIELDLQLFATPSSTLNACVALFRDTTANAIAAHWQTSTANMSAMGLKHYMSSWGLTQSTIAARGGCTSGTLHVNGNASGTRVGGGVLLAYLRATEYLAI